MPAQYPLQPPGVRRRELLKGSLAAGATLSALPLARPSTLWGAPARPHDHRVVGTVCQALRPKHHLRLWQPRRCPVAGPVGGVGAT